MLNDSMMKIMINIHRYLLNAYGDQRVDMNTVMQWLVSFLYLVTEIYVKRHVRGWGLAQLLNHEIISVVSL